MGAVARVWLVFRMTNLYKHSHIVFLEWQIYLYIYIIVVIIVEKIQTQVICMTMVSWV